VETSPAAALPEGSLRTTEFYSFSWNMPYPRKPGQRLSTRPIGTLYTDWVEYDKVEQREVICNLMDETPVLSMARRPSVPTPDFQAKLNIGPLQPGDRERLVKLLEEYMNVFAQDISELGRIKGIRHRIYVGDAKSVKHENEFVQQEIQRLLQKRSYSTFL
jgi:hypothetical protein